MSGSGAFLSPPGFWRERPRVTIDSTRTLPQRRKFSFTLSFDHLVGATEERERDCEAECLDCRNAGSALVVWLCEELGRRMQVAEP